MYYECVARSGVVEHFPNNTTRGPGSNHDEDTRVLCSHIHSEQY